MKRNKNFKQTKKVALGIAFALGCNIWAMTPVDAAEYTAPITGDKTVDTAYTDVISSNVTYTFGEDVTINAVADGLSDYYAAVRSGDKSAITITATDRVVNLNTSGTADTLAGILLTNKKKITLTADTLNIVTKATDDTTVVNGIWNAPVNASQYAANITANNVNIELDGKNGVNGLAIYRTNGTTSNSSSSIVISGDLTVKADTANKNAASVLENNNGILTNVKSAKVQVNGAVDIDVAGNGIVANENNATTSFYKGGNIKALNGTDTNDYYSLYANNGASINYDMNTVSGLNSYSGNVALGGTAQIDGDVYVGASSKLYLAIEGQDSYLKGIVNNSGTMDMMMLNGGSWYNSATNVSEKDTVSSISTLSGNGGAIYQAADSNDINIAKYGTALGTSLNVYYTHDASDPTKILGGNINISKAQAGSEINIITDYSDAMKTAEVQNSVLNALANKLFYTGYINGQADDVSVIEGERNLSGYAQIAEGLTTSSVTKYFADINFDETTGQGYVSDGVVNEAPEAGKQTATEFTEALIGNKAKTGQYIDAGVYKGNGLYSFAEDTSITQTTNNAVAGGAWINTISTGVSSTYGEEALTLDLNGKDLSVDAKLEGSVVGIAAVGSGKVEVINPSKLSVNAEGTGQTAALFVNSGGVLHIANGGDNLEDKVVSLTAYSTGSGNCAVVKSMNGISYGTSWLKIDGLVDVRADVTNGAGAGEGVSAVASTIDIGGGKIIATNDGTGETNFGGSNSLAIRAYGEFVSQNYGIVNVNVIKEADTVNAGAIGAGNNVTQIVGDFSTVGGMGTKGTINVGLNTKDSYWYGDYMAGAGFGVTPGDYGCLNLWMGNEAEWKGYTLYATNLYMDNGAKWEGYSSGNNTLIMSLKNDAMWTPTTAGTSNLTETKVREFTGAIGDETVGSIYMSDDNAVNVTVSKYSGETKLFYKHDAAMPSVIYGGNFTVQSATEGSKITLVTDAEGIDFTSAARIEDVLDSLAGKLFYTGYINGTAEDGSVIKGERNLNGYVEIAEGLTTASVTKYAGDIQFSETTGQGNFAEGTLNPEIAAPVVPEIIESFNQGLTGNVTEGGEDNPYKDIVDEDGTYNFTADETNIVVSTIGSTSVGVATDEENDVTKVNANDNVLNIIVASSKNGDAIGIVADGGVIDEAGNNKAKEVVIDNIGGSTISAQATGSGEAVALNANNGGKIVLNAKDGGVINMSADSVEGEATVIKAEGGAEVTVNGKVHIDVADKNVDGAIKVTDSAIVNIADGIIKVAEGNAAIQASEGAEVNLSGSVTGNLVTRKPQARMMFAMRNNSVDTTEATEPILTVINYDVKGEFKGDYVGDAESKLNLTATKGNNWTGNIVEDSYANVTLEGGNWTGAHLGEELNLNISKGSIWTNVNENETIIDELVGAENINKGTVGVIRMFEKFDDNVKGYGDIVINNYKGSVIFDYALAEVDKHSEENVETVVAEENSGYQIAGGKVTIHNAVADSEVVLSTAREFVDMYDATEAEVFAALAEQINVNKYEVDNLKGYVAITEGLTNPEIKLSVSEIDFNTKVDEETGYAQGYIDKDNVNIDSNIVYGDSETALMSGAKSAMASTAMMWRAESNDLMKRMGDLRMAEGEHGVWAKYYGGKYEMDAQKANFSTSYNAYQVGYDRKVGHGWTVGGAMSYSTGNSSYTRGDGDTSVMSLGLYGTWKNNDGQYVDLILKRSKLDNEFEVANTSGVNIEADYEAWATSISAEYGKRITKGKGFYFDPSVELTLGRVEGEEYDAKTDYLGGDYKLRVQQDDFDSLIGRIGLRVGQKLDNASYYAKFAVAKEFCGDYDTKYWTVDGSGKAMYPSGTSIDLGDTWYELQLGGSTKLSDNSLIYATFERSFGGDVEQKWRVDAGLRWSF